jgi:tRNA(fMet)-specific endonuclease VapC
VADPSFLLDSNICIYVLADAEGPAAKRLGAAVPGSVVTSMIACAEVLRGIGPAERAALASADRLFELVPPLPFNVDAAHAYARLPFRRARFDRLIAAHALALGLTLVTNNERDFADIPGLKVENWVLPL